MRDYLEIIGRGGPLVYPIFLASVVALAVFIERVIAFRRSRVFPEDLARAVLDLVGQNNHEAALNLARRNVNPLGNLIASALDFRGRGRGLVKERMEEVGGLEIATLGRYVGILSTIATVTPLLGLLGTVTGMVKVFQSVALVENPEISQLAGGIWEALLTTVAGLAVAIPAFLAFRYLESRLDRAADTLQEYGLVLLDHLYPTWDASAKPEAEE